MIKTYRTVIMSVVLHGCEAWFLILRDGHRLWVFENRVLRRTFGPRRDEMTGEWKRLHNKQLYTSIHLSSNIIRVIKSRNMRWVRHVKRKEKQKGIQGFSGEKWGKENTSKT
jgi:hypothetical protein